MTNILNRDQSVEIALLENGFVREMSRPSVWDNKSVGLTWSRYTHPDLAKMEGCRWGTAVVVKPSFQEESDVEIGFALYHPGFLFHLDLSESFGVIITKEELNVETIRSAINSLFSRYSGLQMLLVKFNKRVSMSEESKKNVRDLFSKVSLSTPISMHPRSDLNHIDFSTINLSIDNFQTIGKVIDLLCFYNHFILQCEYFIGSEFKSGPFSNIQRLMNISASSIEEGIDPSKVMGLQKRFASAVLEFIGG